MTIYLASDHAGFELKEKIKEYLQDNHQVIDEGAFTFDKSDDYPLLIEKAAKKVSDDEDSLGIVFGKSGSGEEIVANKFKNVRAILGFSEENVKLGREHNNANILSLGSDFVDFDKAKALVDIFINTPFSKDQRHEKRIEEIKEIEEKNA